MKIIYLIIYVCLGILVISCGDSNVNSSDEKIVKIGVLLPASGSGSSTGEGIKVALDTYIHYYNNLEILKPFKLELIYQDTETNPSVCLNKLTELNNQGIKIIIGPYSSSELEYIKDYVKTNKMIILSPSSVAVSLAIPDDNIFRFAPNDSSQAQALNKYLEFRGIDYLAGTYRDDVWGKDIATLVSNNHIFKGTFSDNFYTYLTDLSNLSNSINSLAQTVSGYYKDNISGFGLYFASFNEGTDVLLEMLKTTLSSHSNMQLIGSSAFANNSTILNSPNASNFAISQNLVCPVFGIPEANKNNVYYNSIKQQLGREPESYAYVAYDIMGFVYSLIWESKYYENNNVDNLLNIIINQSKNYDGLSGNLELDKNGDRKQGNYDFKGIKKVQDKYEWFTKAIYDYQTNKIISKE